MPPLENHESTSRKTDQQGSSVAGQGELEESDNLLDRTCTVVAFKREWTMTTEALLQRITVDPRLCHGQPCVRGMRIMVHQVLDLLAAGVSPQEIIDKDFPDLTLDDIRACIAYANQLVKNEEILVYPEKSLQ